MTPLRTRVEQWMREDQLEKGQLWYLVSTEWWTATFPPLQPTKKTKSNYDRNGTDGDVTMDDATASSSTEDAKTTRAIRNAPLVDEAHSSKSSSCVVLIPRLAEQRDYLVVSRRVWELLSEEFGFDWTIFRMVVESGPNHTLRVEIYPPMFKFLYWRNGMEEPELVNEVQPATERDYVSPGKPVVLVRSEDASIYDIHSWIRTKLSRRMREFFPEVKFEDVKTQVQVAYRVTDTAPWTALTDAIEKPKTEETTTISDLLLEPRDYKDGDERFHHLLIETRWRPLPSEPQYPRVGSLKRDWRFDRYYSGILAEQWRWQLEIGQLIDALDTDKKWYEARVLDLDDDRVKVHFLGWTPKWDEWMPRVSDRMQQLHTRVPNWRAFKVGDGVQVGTPIVDRAYPEWRNATVVKVETVDANGDQEAGLRILVKDDVREKWMDAQDEMLCRPGTHKAVNAATITSKTSTTTTTTNLITARSSYSNKSRDYSYDYGRGKPDYPGVVGLQNLGNTCFMNSMLQCLNNAKPLKDYFLAKNELDGEPLFEKDVNEDNPLGMKGMIAREFAKLVTRMWSNEYTTVSPTGLKSVIGKYAPQFAGYQQQDSQEVMNFILDGLHEDLNRVKKKPYTTPVERNGRGDDEVAQEEWAQYLLRNDSVIVENFMGQLRSHVTCSNPECTNESTTFDPFMSLSVPLPSDERVSVKVQLFWANGSIPMKYAVRVAKNATMREVKEKLSELCSVPLPRLVFVEVRDHRIKKIHRDLTAIEDLTEDIVHAYELEFPFNEYELCSSNLRPLVASFGSRWEPTKSMRLVALLHQAPVASPVDGRQEPDDLLEDRSFGAKQRRVEVELMNTPLLVSIDAGLSSEQVHDKVWQIVSRLVADELQYDDKSLVPYRLHVTNPNGASPLIRDFPNTSAFVELPDPKKEDYCFTLEWRRMGLELGYDEQSAKRTELHESMRQLKISSSPQDDAVTLVNCLTKFMEREQLGKTDTWYCPKCKQHVRAFKKFDLFALPKVLIFQLKRFRYAQSSFYMHRDKITTQVTFPIDNLDLSGFVVGPQRHGELVYDLFAVSEHSGGLGGGHYTAVGKNPENKKWYSYNDSFTKAADAEDAVTPRAYVLFYVRRE